MFRKSFYTLFVLAVTVVLVLSACAPAVSQPIATPPEAEAEAPTEPPAEEAAPTEPPAAEAAPTEAPAATVVSAPAAEKYHFWASHGWHL